jgi:hypothetical protein
MRLSRTLRTKRTSKDTTKGAILLTGKQQPETFRQNKSLVVVSLGNLTGGGLLLSSSGNALQQLGANVHKNFQENLEKFEF